MNPNRSSVRSSRRAPAWYLGLALVAALGAPPAWAAGIERFYGEYEGQALSDDGGELSPRDMSVSIRPAGRGFEVAWTSVISKASGRVKRTDVTIQFLPSRRDGLYRSAMTNDLFGNPVPLDPLKGQPYVWARLQGDVLTVHALHITDSGGYEIQVYERTLVEGGLWLRYSRIRDGAILRSVTGELKRR